MYEKRYVYWSYLNKVIEEFFCEFGDGRGVSGVGGEGDCLSGAGRVEFYCVRSLLADQCHSFCLFPQRLFLSLL